MTRTREEIQAGLGASSVRSVKTAARTPFALMRLREELADRLQPGKGRRPGRPTDGTMDIRRPIRFRRSTWDGLNDLAHKASTDRRRVSAGQVAAVLLDELVLRLQSHPEAQQSLEEHVGALLKD